MGPILSLIAISAAPGMVQPFLEALPVQPAVRTLGIERVGDGIAVPRAIKVSSLAQLPLRCLRWCSCRALDRISSRGLLCLSRLTMSWWVGIAVAPAGRASLRWTAHSPSRPLFPAAVCYDPHDWPHDCS